MNSLTSTIFHVMGSRLRNVAFQSTGYARFFVAKFSSILFLGNSEHIHNYWKLSFSKDFLQIR
jgi:hypothetical protein